MNLASLPRVAFWLVPRCQERATLQSLIVDLARRFSAPVFVPHVTVYSCRRTLGQRELAVMTALARSCRPIAANPASLASTGRLTQALFARLPDLPEISALSRALHAGVPMPSDYGLVPHMSLLYQKLAPAARKTLLCEIALCLSEIRFDALWAVAIPEQIRELDDLRGWRPLVISRLDSSGIVDTLEA